LGKEKPGLDVPTAINRTDVAKGIGPRKTAQSATNQITQWAKEGGCRDRNHNVFFNKNGPMESTNEENMRKGSNGNEINAETSQALGESEQIGYSWNNETTAYKEKLRNEAFIAISTNPIAAEEERRRISPCLPAMIEKEGGVLSHQASSVSGKTKVSEEDPMLSITRVEDSQCSSPVGEIGETHQHLAIVNKEQNHKQSPNQIASRSGQNKGYIFTVRRAEKDGVRREKKGRFSTFGKR